MNASGSIGVLLRLALAVLPWLAAPAQAEPRLMLVVGAQSTVQELNTVQVQRLFLGLTVIVKERRLYAVRNQSDDLMHRVFFQNIVFLSEAAYDRRMLALTLQQGRTAPPVVRSTAALLELLTSNPDAVSFAWADDIARDPRVKPLRMLWHQ